MNNTYLSIIIPCFNEKNTILEIINQVRKIKDIKKQIILIDDGSTDGTRDLIKKNLKNKVDKVILHKKKYGQRFGYYKFDQVYKRELDNNSRCRFRI